jgi:hypothetical protein
MLVVDPPTNPQPPLGLLAAARPLEMPAHGAFEGIQYEPEACGVVHLYPGVCDDTPPVKDLDDPGDGVAEGAPFLVYASMTCGLAGRSIEEHSGRVLRRLQAREGWGVERAFWGDDAAVPGYLQSLALTSLGDAGLVEALSILEQDAADNYGMPVLIHARTGLAAWLGAAGLIRNVTSDGATYTWRGNRVVFGDGYGDSDEAGVAFAAGTGGLFATGPVTIWRDANAEVAPAAQTLDRSTNQVKLLAERAFVVVHECYAGYVGVTGLETAGA